MFFEVDLVMRKVGLQLVLPLEVLLRVMSTIEMELNVIVGVEEARGGVGFELRKLLLFMILRVLSMSSVVALVISPC